MHPASSSDPAQRLLIERDHTRPTATREMWI
jgi:hypothetical protein